MHKKILFTFLLFCLISTAVFAVKIDFGGYTQMRAQTVDPYRDYSTGDDVDNYLFRRLGIQLLGEFNDQLGFCVQWDFSTYKSSFKDVYLSFKPTEGWLMKLGRQTWPFGYYVEISSAGMNFMERPLFVRRLFPGDRDPGLSAKYEDDNIIYKFGIFNGAGMNYRDTISDENSTKDLVASVSRKSGDNLRYGISAYYGKGAWAKPLYNKDCHRLRYGADIEYKFGDGWRFIGEAITGKGVDIANAAWESG